MNGYHSNLLSRRFRLYLLIRQRLTQWSITWALLLAGSLGWWFYRASQVGSLGERVALMEARSNPVQELRTRNQRIQQQLADMHRHELLLYQLDDEKIPYHLLALVSAKVVESQGRVQIQSFSMQRYDRLGTDSTTGNRANPIAADRTVLPLAELSLTGRAQDNLAVSLFVASLRDSGVFENVDLKSSVGARRDAEQSQTFIVHCGL